MALHSRFGGSIADRYMNCAGSVALCATVPPKKVGVKAEIGTAAHDLAALCLTTDTDAAHYVGEFFPREDPGPLGRFLCTEEMARAVQVYLDAVRAELALTPDAELYVEVGFAFDLPSAEEGEVFGTTDAMVYHPSTGRLRVFDYKHGEGISVSAEDNSQLKFYAGGAVFSKPDWRLTKVILTIAQPRARDADEVGKIKDFELDVLELLEFHGQLDAAVAAAKGAEAYARNAGSVDAALLNPYPDGQGWCRWCDAAAVCPAKDADAIKAATLDFKDVNMTSVTEITAAALPDPKTLPLERLAKVVAGLQIAIDWMNLCQEILEGMVLGGHVVPGWKAVEKIGRAKWVEDPAEVTSYAGLMFGLAEDQVSPRKLTTITEMEKLLKAQGATKEQIDDFKLKFTIKESSGLTIAPSSDRRPAVNAVAADFGSVNTSSI
jgi:hypothetical protein